MGDTEVFKHWRVLSIIDHLDDLWESTSRTEKLQFFSKTEIGSIGVELVTEEGWESESGGQPKFVKYRELVGSKRAYIVSVQIDDFELIDHLVTLYDELLIAETVLAPIEPIFTYLLIDQDGYLVGTIEAFTQESIDAQNRTELQMGWRDLFFLRYLVKLMESRQQT